MRFGLQLEFPPTVPGNVVQSAAFIGDDYANHKQRLHTAPVAVRLGPSQRHFDKREGIPIDHLSCQSALTYLMVTAPGLSGISTDIPVSIKCLPDTRFSPSAS